MHPSLKQHLKIIYPFTLLKALISTYLRNIVEHTLSIFYVLSTGIYSSFTLSQSKVIRVWRPVQIDKERFQITQARLGDHFHLAPHCTCSWF